MNGLMCVACGCTLIRKEAPVGTVWECPSCRGALLSRDMLRVQLAQRGPGLWSRARVARESATRTCPQCTRALRVWRELAGAANVELDACPVCELLWFDRGEQERVIAAARSGALGVRGDIRLERAWDWTDVLLWLP